MDSAGIEFKFPSPSVGRVCRRVGSRSSRAACKISNHTCLSCSVDTLLCGLPTKHLSNKLTYGEMNDNLKFYRTKFAEG